MLTPSYDQHDRRSADFAVSVYQPSHSKSEVPFDTAYRVLRLVKCEQYSRELGDDNQSEQTEMKTEVPHCGTKLSTESGASTSPLNMVLTNVLLSSFHNAVKNRIVGCSLFPVTISPNSRASNRKALDQIRRHIPTCSPYTRTARRSDPYRPSTNRRIASFVTRS